TWVHNRNINYTNVCTFKCKFCAFSKGPMSENLRGKPYLLTLEDVQERVVEALITGSTRSIMQTVDREVFANISTLRVRFEIIRHDFLMLRAVA
ncbi:MAG: radical SAM protein, partial [Alphaproteobacteria bacterium]